MKLQEVNDLFGDMDLPLMDAILKGHLPATGSVLDAGCGAGRNALYFLKQGYTYHGWDNDPSQIQLLTYVANGIQNIKANFQVVDLHEAGESKDLHDVIICSRVLHFAKDEDNFLNLVNTLRSNLKPKGVFYVAMDSAVDNTVAKPLDAFRWEFPDGKIRFALTKAVYQKMKKGFEEIEPLKTFIQSDKRAHSFALLRKC